MDKPIVTTMPFNIQDAIGLWVFGSPIDDLEHTDSVKVETIHHCFGRPAYAVVNAETEPRLVNYYQLACAVSGEEVDPELESAFIKTEVEEKKPWALKHLQKQRAVRTVRKLKRGRKQRNKSSDIRKVKGRPTPVRRTDDTRGNGN